MQSWAEEEVSSLCLHDGPPPLPAPWGGDIPEPYLRSIVLSTVGVMLRGTGRNAWKGASPPLFTLEVIVMRTSFCGRPHHMYSTSGLDLGCGGDIDCVRLHTQLCHSSQGDSSYIPRVWLWWYCNIYGLNLHRKMFCRSETDTHNSKRENRVKTTWIKVRTLGRRWPRVGTAAQLNLRSKEIDSAVYEFEKRTGATKFKNRVLW